MVMLSVGQFTDESVNSQEGKTQCLLRKIWNNRRAVQLGHELVDLLQGLAAKAEPTKVWQSQRRPLYAVDWTSPPPCRICLVSSRRQRFEAKAVHAVLMVIASSEPVLQIAKTQFLTQPMAENQKGPLRIVTRMGPSLNMGQSTFHMTSPLILAVRSSFMLWQ